MSSIRSHFPVIEIKNLVRSMNENERLFKNIILWKKSYFRSTLKKIPLTDRKLITSIIRAPSINPKMSLTTLDTITMYTILLDSTRENKITFLGNKDSTWNKKTIEKSNVTPKHVIVKRHARRVKKKSVTMHSVTRIRKMKRIRLKYIKNRIINKFNVSNHISKKKTKYYSRYKNLFSNKNINLPYTLRFKDSTIIGIKNKYSFFKKKKPRLKHKLFTEDVIFKHQQFRMR